MSCVPWSALTRFARMSANSFARKSKGRSMTAGTLLRNVSPARHRHRGKRRPPYFFVLCVGMGK